MLFDYQLKDAANILGVGITYFKKMCRKCGIKKWPFRQRQSIKQLEEKAVLTLSQMLLTNNPNIFSCTAETDTDTEM